MRRKASQAPEQAKGRFGQILDEGRASALRGKKIAVFVDDCEYETEAFLLESTLFEPLGARGEVIKYSSLFSGNIAEADILLLRSTREFAYDKEALKGALLRLREVNPDSVIILCALDPSVYGFAVPLLEAKVIDHLDQTLAGDLGILNAGLESKGRK